MKRLVLACALILCLVPLCAWAEEPDTVAVRCDKEGVSEFLAAYALTCPNGVPAGEGADGEDCFNVTPESVAEETDMRVFKFGGSCRSYVLADGRVYDLCEGIGGYGFVNAVPWDYDGDGRKDLLAASSWGSGLHRSEVTVFDRAAKTSTVIYSTMYEPEPQTDLVLRIGREAGGAPAVSLWQAEILMPADGDFARLRYRPLGPYVPETPFVTVLPPWDADRAAPFMGAWYAGVDELGDDTGMILELSGDGQAEIRLVEEKKLYHNDTASTVPYRITEDGAGIILGSTGEMSAYACSVTDDALRISFFWPDQTVFRRLGEEDRPWLEALQPKYRPGDVSGAVIDRGTSARFTDSQLDGAARAVLEAFRSYCGCALHRLAYAGDEQSAREYTYYAGMQGRKTGKTYVDGAVFTSSFHTPPEDEAAPLSGFSPDDEYTGWNWVLLLTEDGEWELAQWGQA